MIRLEAYRPLGNDVLLQVKEVTKSRAGVLLPQPKRDRIMKVLRTGSLVDGVKPGDWILVGPHGQGVEFTVADGDGEKILAFQTSVHSIIGLYDKDETNEDQVFMTEDPDQRMPHEEAPGPKNIIDNPGIEKAPFLNAKHVSFHQVRI